MEKSHLLGAVCACIFTFFTTTTFAALVDNGGGLIYDDVLNITWAQPDNTLRTWDQANTWASGLTLGGVGGWRLPYISVNAGAGPFGGNPVDCRPGQSSTLACEDNEMGYMFYHTLDGTFSTSILTSGNPALLALFPTLQSDGYWSGTEIGFEFAWHFRFNSGVQDGNNVISEHYSWAVHSGNVSPIPVPAAAWLFGSGLLGLIGAARHKTATLG
jgi:hypothetical protein